jgi:hypothetical protein
MNIKYLFIIVFLIFLAHSRINIDQFGAIANKDTV